MMNLYSKQNIFRVLTVHTVGIGGLFLVGVTKTSLSIALFGFLFRYFFLAAGYHRYFSHRSYETSRWFQWIIALVASSSGHKGPLSWATSHRRHHQYADLPGDPHAPVEMGLFDAYIGWVLKKNALPTDPTLMADFYKYPEIRWLDRNHMVGPFIYLGIIILLGKWIELVHPELLTSCSQVVIAGFFFSTLLCAHAAMIVNTVCHTIGTRNFNTPDRSTNVAWLTPYLLGENWHNNHHAFPRRASNTTRWYEIDLIFFGLKILNLCGLVWNLKR